jgi:hypothetical protein
MRIVLVGGGAQRRKADLAIGEARPDIRKFLGGVALALAQLGIVCLDLGEVRRDLGTCNEPVRLVLLSGGAQRFKANLGIREARPDMGKFLGDVALALAQLGIVCLDLGELCRQGNIASVSLKYSCPRELVAQSGHPLVAHEEILNSFTRIVRLFMPVTKHGNAR